MQTKSHNSHIATHKSGFTLIELLVVVAIISILAGILFPVFARAREQARKAACMSNLKQIGLGLMMYVQDYDETYPTARGRIGSTSQFWYWYDVLQPYIKNEQVFICPTAGEIKDSDGERLGSGGYGWNIGGRRGPSGIGENGFGYIMNELWKTASGSGPVTLAGVEEPANTILITDPPSNGQFNGYVAVGYGSSSYTPVLHGGQVGPFTGGSVNPGLGGGGNYIFADGHVKWLAASQSFNRDVWNVEKGYSPK